jgi:Na+-translocating ferredoxin:NAD+ oxidoreductase RnfG subunit
MIYGILVFAIISTVLSIVVYYMATKAKENEALIEAQQNQIASLRLESDAQKELIKKIQEAEQNAKNRKKKIETGSDADRFASSVGILRDIASPKP